VLDHVGLNVSDIERSKAFYVEALAPLGYSLFRDLGQHIGFLSGRAPDFWISQRGEAGRGTHVSFRSPDRATVDAFHAAAVAAGGTDNGPPGLRPQYHEQYYGAFVLDPDGNNIEAVCHRPG
jgi:catechol 2,3-dioxygenase-like lactoylglutathione lyase family enzyme